jgi:hypothetical protein
MKRPPHIRIPIDAGIPGSSGYNAWTPEAFAEQLAKAEALAERDHTGDDWMCNALKNIAIAVSPHVWDNLATIPINLRKPFIQGIIDQGGPFDDPFPSPKIMPSRTR